MKKIIFFVADQNKYFDLNDFLQCKVPPGPMQQHHCALAIGGALRQEGLE